VTGQHTAAALVYLGYCTADNLDGKHARATKQCSEWGGILDHCVDGSCSTPAVALTMSVFLGVPLVPVMRMFAFTFFAAHIVEAATGELHMGAGSRWVGGDEIGLLVAAAQYAVGQGYTGDLGSYFPDTDLATVFPRLALITFAMNLKILVEAGSKCDWRKVLLWSPVCAAILACPLGDEADASELEWKPFLTLHAIFFIPLLLVTMANGGKLVASGKEAGKAK